MSKPAAKPAAKQRKSKRVREASLDDSDASMASSLAVSLPSPLRDLSNSKNSRKVVATAILSILPDGATKQSAHGKKLLSAFPLVAAELEARSRALASKSESEGTRLPLAFRFNDGDGETVINMPEECFANVLKFLRGPEIVRSSLVSKVWLSACRMPSLWERVDRQSGLNNWRKKMNMTSFLQLLNRPQFANLKVLVLPENLRPGAKSFKQIAKACPRLEALDVGYSPCITGHTGHLNDAGLVVIAENFARLTTLRFDMWNATNEGIATLVRAFGDQLLDLRIQGYVSYLSDDVLRAVAASCSGLKYFFYQVPVYTYKEENDQLSGAGAAALVEGCRRLEILSLKGTKRVAKADVAGILQTIANANDSGEDESFALRHFCLAGCLFHVVGNPIKGDPFGIVDTTNRRCLECFGEDLRI